VQTLPSKGAASAARSKVLLAHYKTPGVSSAAAAATAASNAAAARAGLLPGLQMAGGAMPGPFNGAGEGRNRSLHCTPVQPRGGAMMPLWRALQVSTVP
jgi:hypothetical protein